MKTIKKYMLVDSIVFIQFLSIRLNNIKDSIETYKKAFNNFLYETKTKIGYTHAIISTLGAILLAYLTAMFIATIIVGDFALKIIPAMMLTPIFMSLYGIWLLFSKTRIEVLKKICLVLFILSWSLIIKLGFI